MHRFVFVVSCLRFVHLKWVKKIIYFPSLQRRGKMCRNLIVYYRVTRVKELANRKKSDMGAHPCFQFIIRKQICFSHLTQTTRMHFIKEGNILIRSRWAVIGGCVRHQNYDTKPCSYPNYKIYQRHLLSSQVNLAGPASVWPLSWLMTSEAVKYYLSSILNMMALDPLELNAIMAIRNAQL